MMKQLNLLLFGVMIMTSAMGHEGEDARDHIAVVGIGEIEAEPDQAILRVTVSAQEPDLAAAKRLADERYQKVLDVIKQADIDDKLVKVTQVVAQPQYEWRESQQLYKGELVSRLLNITMRDLNKVSPLMQALVENGVSTIDGIETGFQDRAALMQAALAAAADDAKQKAKFLAERLGRNLGSAYLITETNEAAIQQAFSSGPELARASVLSAVSAPPDMFGTQKVRARVSVSFNLL